MGEPRFTPTDSRCPNCGGTKTHQWSCPDWRMCDDCQADWGIRDHRWGEIWAAAIELASLTADLRVIYPHTCACGLNRMSRAPQEEGLAMRPP